MVLICLAHRFLALVFDLLPTVEPIEAGAHDKRGQGGTQQFAFHISPRMRQAKPSFALIDRFPSRIKKRSRPSMDSWLPVREIRERL
jgi:hypothetical protein